MGQRGLAAASEMEGPGSVWVEQLGAAYAGKINYTRYLGAADFIDEKLAADGFNDGDRSLLPKVDGGYPLDPTHPGTQARIQLYINKFKNKFKALGFAFIKLDFVSHGSLEGVHAEPAVRTGIEAYNKGMDFILRQIGGQMFVSLSIAPLFPAGYGHARRISCDTKGHINGERQSTEYMLNSLTYGWWTNGSLYITDPDHVALGPVADEGARTENEARSRMNSAVISGGLILDSSRLAEDKIARTFAQSVYTNKHVNAIAQARKAFRPVEGTSGDRAADIFYRPDEDQFYVAVFNFDPSGQVRKRKDFARIDKSLVGKAVQVRDTWTDESLETAIGTMQVDLEPAESKLLKLIPVK